MRDKSSLSVSMSEQPVVVVTGGEGALGTAMRSAFSAMGYRAVSFDVAIKSNADDAMQLQVDISSPVEVDEAFAQVADAFGRVDVLVNNAGVTNRKDTATLPLEDWRLVIDTHLTGTFLCARAAYPLLRQSDAAAIVNVSSVVGHLGLPRRAAYSAAKAGVEGLTRCLAAEWSVDGIRVNAVVPGYIRTPHQEEMFARGVLSESLIKGRSLLGDLGVPDDIAAATVFLASPPARFITGQTLIVDGGLTIAGNIDPPQQEGTR
jgi:NAD(P)-dependent dehydrogenase (short-subunit alcohol dehydrogenase family)